MKLIHSYSEEYKSLLCVRYPNELHEAQMTYEINLYISIDMDFINSVLRKRSKVFDNRKVAVTFGAGML